MTGRKWDWLSGPLAHDFANTIHWRGTTPIDHIADQAGLRSWLDHEPHDLPEVSEVTESLTEQTRTLRDAVRAAMTAVAAGHEPGVSDLDVINDMTRRHPMTRVLGANGVVLEPPPTQMSTLSSASWPRPLSPPWVSPSSAAESRSAPLPAAGGSSTAIALTRSGATPTAAPERAPNDTTTTSPAERTDACMIGWCSQRQSRMSPTRSI